MPLFGRKKAVDPRTPAEAVALPEPPEPGPDGLRSLADYRDYLLSCVEPMTPFRQQILDAVDLAVCEDVVSEINLPAFDNSAMDGYAVRAVDVATASAEAPVRLPVVGEVPAGQPAPHRLSPGTAMKIMTGAPIPAGADAVVAYERTDRGTEEVLVFGGSGPGQHIRRLGDDVEAGQTLFAEGDQLSPRSIGLLAAIGRDTVLVRPRPRVAVIATGSELTEPGRPLAGEQMIYDSNSYLVAAAATAAGAHTFRIGLVSDDPAEVKQVILDQLVRADLVVSTGGVSQGDYDVVKAVLPELGSCEFPSVAMQPGKPQGFGLVGPEGTPMIMLPGNPVSAFVSFEAFVRPVIRKLMGTEPYVRPAVRARAAEAMTSLPGRTQLARGIVRTGADGQLEVEPAGGHGSHLLGGLARANALILLPEDVEVVAAGDDVDVWLLGETL